MTLEEKKSVAQKEDPAEVQKMCKEIYFSRNYIATLEENKRLREENLQLRTRFTEVANSVNAVFERYDAKGKYIPLDTVPVAA